MKIKTKTIDFDELKHLPTWKIQHPKRPPVLFRSLLKIVGAKDLKQTGFSYNLVNMKKLPDVPCLILMNHSAFIDLEIVTSVMFPRPVNIVCTSDGFVGKKWLMRNLGCIPTKKFVTDVQLVKDIFYAVRKLKDSVLMYPEASYSFDGTATPIPSSLGKLIKKLAIPVIMFKTHGAFLRDPLYNELKKRNVKVHADVECLLNADDCTSRSVDEINSILKERFTFDNFKSQYESHTEVSETFRADGLNRVLYKCPHCQSERHMEGKCTVIKCNNCGQTYELTKFGKLENITGGKTMFDFVSSWYSWERECVKNEITDGNYNLDTDVSISILKNSKTLYNVGKGHLSHTKEGFHLTGCNGRLDIKTTVRESYSLYSDYFWYEIGDVICIGNGDLLYYCFPEDKKVNVAKARLAAEELYKLQEK